MHYKLNESRSIESIGACTLILETELDKFDLLSEEQRWFTIPFALPFPKGAQVWNMF